MRALLASTHLHSAVDGCRWQPCATIAPASVTWTKKLEQRPSAAGNKHSPQPAPSVPPLQPQEEQQLVTEALGQSYRQQLESVRDLLTPEAIEQLRATLPPSDLASLERVLEDIKRIDQQKGPSVEPALPSRPLAQQLAAVHATYEAAEEHVKSMPADFRSYLLETVFVGAGEDELEVLIDMMGREQLQQLAQVYEDMVQFQYQPPELLAEKYVELSSRMEALAQQAGVSETSPSTGSTQQPSPPAVTPAAQAQPQPVLPTTALRPHLAPMQLQRRQRRRTAQQQQQQAQVQAQAQAQVQSSATPEQAQRSPSEGSSAPSATAQGAVAASSRGRTLPQDPDAWLVRPPEALQGILPPPPVIPLPPSRSTGAATRRRATTNASAQQSGTAAQLDGRGAGGQQQSQAAQPLQQAALTQHPTSPDQEVQQQQQQVSTPGDSREQLKHAPASGGEHAGGGSRSPSSSPERRQRRAQASGRSMLLPR